MFSNKVFCAVSHFEFNKQLFSNIEADHRRKKPFNRENRPHCKNLKYIISVVRS